MGTFCDEQNSNKSPTQPAWAVAGPPTLSRRSTLFSATADCLYSSKYSAFVPDQKNARFGSFHTSKFHLLTSSIPYRSTQCVASARINSPHCENGSGGVIFPR